jgi:hypothetical protein
MRFTGALERSELSSLGALNRWTSLPTGGLKRALKRVLTPDPATGVRHVRPRRAAVMGLGSAPSLAPITGDTMPFCIWRFGLRRNDHQFLGFVVPTKREVFTAGI